MVSNVMDIDNITKKFVYQRKMMLFVYLSRFFLLKTGKISNPESFKECSGLNWPSCELKQIIYLYHSQLSAMILSIT